MNNAYAMSATLESRKNTKATMITAGFAGLMVLLMFLLKWKLPVFERIVPEPGIEVQLNLPEEPIVVARGGGGGGNPVHAAEPAGTAPQSPPQPGVKEDSKDIEDDKDKENPEVLKPNNPKPTATKIENTSVTKTTPKPVVETPAPPPPRPKAVVGKTLTGSGKGGGADDYERSGGKGNGNGVGDGNGNDGGKGNGNGGGNGPGSGGGSGPKITNGDRKIVRYYSFPGDLEKAVVYANINVSPAGVGQFVSIARGSSTSSGAYKEAIIQYLQNIRFDKADHESMCTVQFNFKIN